MLIITYIHILMYHIKHSYNYITLITYISRHLRTNLNFQYKLINKNGNRWLLFLLIMHHYMRQH